MILKAFPDYQWLKKQAETAFQNRRGWNRASLAHQGWPTVILNTQTTQSYRPDIKGTFSLFCNISGESHVKADKYQVKLDNQHFFITNESQYYSLIVESEKPTETFNIHFGSAFFADLVHDYFSDHEKLLDNPESPEATFSFFNQITPFNANIKNLLQQLHRHAQSSTEHSLYVDELLAKLGCQLMEVETEKNKNLENIQSAKAATRQEIFKRIGQAADYIYSHPEKSISLEELAQAATMSKFHFLRAFKAYYRVTPHQFILQTKLEKARELLKGSSLPIQEVGLMVGLEDKSSFSRMFKKHFGCPPSALRKN